MKAALYDPVSFSGALTKVVKQVRHSYTNKGVKTGILTGLANIDKKIGGFHQSSLVVLAGRPLMGKTALATGMAFDVAQRCHATSGRDGAGVLFFSLEMSSEQLTSRILASLTSVPTQKMHHGDVDHTDILKFEEANQRFGTLPFYIDDTAALSVDDICERVRSMKNISPVLGLIVIDSIQRVRGSTVEADLNGADQVADILQRLKFLAVELEVSILVLSHISRAVEQYDDKRPRLTDLRQDCPLIERSADVIMSLYRDEYYLELSQPEHKIGEAEESFSKRYDDWSGALENAHGNAECIVARNNYGSVGIVKLHFDSELARFSNQFQG